MLIINNKARAHIITTKGYKDSRAAQNSKRLPSGMVRLNSGMNELTEKELVACNEHPDFVGLVDDGTFRFVSDKAVVSDLPTKGKAAAPKAPKKKGSKVQDVEETPSSTNIDLALIKNWPEKLASIGSLDSYKAERDAIEIVRNVIDLKILGKWREDTTASRPGLFDALKVQIERLEAIEASRKRR